MKKSNNDDNNNCHSLEIRKSLSDFQKMIIYFYIYSFIGWVTETVYALCITGTLVKRGFLYGFMCPIYGFGAILMLLFISKYKDNSIKTFFASAIIFSIFEYIVGFALEATLKIRLWDYTQDFFNINGRISLMYTLFWGIAGILFINHLHPFVNKIIKKISNKLSYINQVNIITLFTIIFLSDTVLSCLKYIKLF